LKYPPFPWAQNFQYGAHQTTEIIEKGRERLYLFQKFLLFGVRHLENFVATETAGISIKTRSIY
jgi:hypothetical protein